MNKVKLTIKNDAGETLCKIGTSINQSKDEEYSDSEIANLLRKMADLLDCKSLYED